MSAALQQDDRIYGIWQQPENKWQGQPNSIHNDAVAKKVGMRGGTIPGTVHLDHFRPILTQLSGDRWFRQGSISMFYTYATKNREDVRAIVKKPPQAAGDIQIDAWVETPEGRVVCKGTVAVGKPKDVPYVRSLALENAEPGINRILANMKPGQEMPAREDYIVKEGGEGGALLEPQLMYPALAAFPPDVDTAPADGFFRATRLRLPDGPLTSRVPPPKSR